MTRILIADDHPMVRAGIRQFLEEDTTITAIGEAACAGEVLEQLSASLWHLLLLDISMPDRNGLDILNDIRARHGATKVLILSGLPPRQYAVSVLNAGARGYLAKECTAQELLRATRRVLNGGRYLSDDLSDILLSGLNEATDEPLHQRLSKREFPIFCKLAVGYTVSYIADELLLSAKTVSTYRKRILDKLCLTSNAELTAYAIRYSVVQ